MSRPLPARFVIRGVCGSSPASGSVSTGYGSGTTCFTLETRSGWIVIDAGSGLASFEAELQATNNQRPISMIFTHFHLDHLIGLPSFGPLYTPQQRLRLMADPRRTPPWHNLLTSLMAPPLWPVPMTGSAARLEFHDLPIASHGLDLYGIHITWCPVWHPQDCLAFRLEIGGVSIVVATDREPGLPEYDKPFQKFCQGADWLILDAQYTPAEIALRRGWGHGNWQEAAALARQTNVRNLVLTHHDPKRQNSDLDAIAEQARKIFPATRTAFDGFAIEA
ncbi:MAG: MBL fold metallo-hydrolase [bacterium]